VDTTPTPTGERILFVSLCAAIAFETLFFWTNIGNAYTVPKVAAALLGGAILLPQVCWRFFQDAPSRHLRVLLVLFAIQIIALTWATANSMSPSTSFWGGDWRRMGWITQFAMLSIAVSVPLAIGKDFRRYRALLCVIALTGFVSGIYGISQRLGWDPFLPEFLRDEIVKQFGGTYRSSGTIGQPNYFANYLLYPFFSALALVVYEKARALRFVACGVIVVSAFALRATGSRSGLLGCAAGLGALAVWALTSRLRSSKPSRWKTAIGTGVTAAVLLISADSVSGFFARTTPGGFIMSHLTLMGTDTESVGRIVLWRDVFQRILPHVWLNGAGPGMFRVAFTWYRSDSYRELGPDVHWETPHNIFLDRLAEQGVAGMLAFLALLAAFAYNMTRAIHSVTDHKMAAGHAAIGAGLIAVLVSSSFNGEVIPSTYYLYIWISISFAVREMCERRVFVPDYHAGKRRILERFVVTAAIAASVLMFWYADQNWTAETMLREGARASNSADEPRLLAAKAKAEQAMRHVGTYHLEFAELMVNFLQENRARVSESSRMRLAQPALSSALWAVDRTDNPMLALLNLISLGDMTGDGRTQKWLEQLKKMDPYWYRPHELSALVLLRQRRIDDALREATIARELSPYTESTTTIWRQLISLRREVGPQLQ